MSRPLVRTLVRSRRWKFLGVVLNGAVSLGCGSGVTAPDRHADLSLPAATRPSVPAPPAPSSDEPVTAAAGLSSATAVPGGATEIRVTVRVAGGYHLYTAAAALPPFTAASVEVKRSDQIRPAGRCEVEGADDRGSLRGAAEFRQPLRVSDTAARGRHEVVCTLTYQACNDELCWPPQTLVLRTSLTVVPRPRTAKESP
jgi:hypothetical protein